MAESRKTNGAEKTIVQEKPKLWSFFDKSKKSHTNILSLCIQFGWSKTHPTKGNEIADLLALHKWLKSVRSPVQKPLMEMKASEVSKIITALENMVTKKHENSN